MNQVEDQKALIDFLEGALAQAEGPKTSKTTHEWLEQELRQALLDYAEASTETEQPSQTLMPFQSIPSPQAVEGCPEIQLLVARQVWYEALWDNLRVVFGTLTSDYTNVTAQLAASDFLAEQTPWFRSVWSLVRDLCKSSSKGVSRPITA
jgi:hypothetical protein